MSGISDDLATLRGAIYQRRSVRLTDALAALARVEAEVERLRAERDEQFSKRVQANRRARLARAEVERLTEALDAEPLAILFHDTYERLAPEFGYKTREASAVPWDEVPYENRMLMIATAAEVARAVLAGREDTPPPPRDAGKPSLQ